MRMNLKQIAQCTGAQAVVEPIDPRAIARGVTWDSRDVTAGDVYVALPGERADGHDFVASALRQGALGALVMQPLDEGVLSLARELGAAVLEVPDTAHAIEDMAAQWRQHLTGKVVAITGSTGKTTTKNLVRDVAASCFTVCATQGNQNNELGVPKTILRAEADTQVVVVEMGMRGAGQITALCDYVRPDWGVVVNVGEAHIELLGSRENIARAKAELLCALPEGSGKAFVNADDDFADLMATVSNLHARLVEEVFFDGSPSATDRHLSCLDAHPADRDHRVWATDVTLDDQGRPAFLLHCRGFLEGEPWVEETCPCALALRGVHNVSNACAAAAVGRALGIPLEVCVEALSRSLPEAGRQEVLASRDGFTVINDAYNANPESMRASLSTFASMDVAGRRIAVLGDMGELGDFAEACHRGVGRFAAAQGIDCLVCAGPLSSFIAEGALEEGFPEKDLVRCDTVADVLAYLEPVLEPGDAVLVKASHSMGLNRVAEGLVA